MSPREPPLRTCVGCRESAPARELLRLAVVDNVVTPDAARRLPGRGAHLHWSHSCLDQALRRRALTRALRMPGADVHELGAGVGRLLDARSSSYDDPGRSG